MVLLVDEEIHDLDLEVKTGESLTLRLASFSSFPSAKIHVKVQKEGVFDGAFADFSSGSGKMEIHVELLGEGAKAMWNFAGVCQQKGDKTMEASVDHLAPHTSAEVTQYGIAMGEGKLAFFGTSHIHPAMVGSSTAQKEKIIVFDKGAVGKCSPVLRIDENDVVASHSAIVGKLSDEHLFYMLSRGIDRDSAKRLLTLGYLRPILSLYEGALAERIQSCIEGGF
ncbi:MAG: SufD family Fe-S cluster assembly protein [Bacilli bacterium]|nr:SufD family Fe-S cluster assembly protein [Bacilli bacterium]